MTTTTVTSPVTTRPASEGLGVRHVAEGGPGRTRPALLFMAPFLVLYLLFVIGPALYMFVMSFFDTSLVKAGLGSFAALRNYGEALSSSAFWASVWHTIWFTILTTPPLVVLAF